MIRSTVLHGAFVLFLGLLGSVHAGEAAEGFVQLFDGKTLSGWEGNTKIWRVEDGAIVGQTPGIRHNEFLCTEKQYRNFELLLEAQVVGGKGNSGIQFRSKRVPGSTEVSGYQADIGDIIGWGPLYDESRRNGVLAAPDPESVRADLRKIGVPLPVWAKKQSPQLAIFRERLDETGWNTMRIRAVDHHITIYINDALVVDYHEEKTEYSHPGIIALQVHSGPPMEVRFRSIWIKPIGE